MEKNGLNFPDFRFSSDKPALTDWKQIFKNREQKKYSKKSVIVQQGQEVNYLYYIVSGLVEYTYTTDDGIQELLEILGDGNLFCLQPFFGGNPAVGSFVALEDAIITIISCKELDYYINQDYNLAKELLVEFARVTGGLVRQIYTQTYDAERRVEELICLLAEYRKEKRDHNKGIYVGLTQEDLARIARTTRVTVTKALGELRKYHLIETAYGGLLVRDLEGLKKILLEKENKHYSQKAVSL